MQQAEAAALSATPLEGFVRSYLETTGGAWDEVEPQVYDVMLPDSTSEGLTRVAFDPEALPEHPHAQLASFGTPFVDQLLKNAIGRGRWARFFMIGLNLAPHDLAARLRRSITLPPALSLTLEYVRAMHFPQAAMWFQAEFISDQKEQEILPVAMDLHYGREVRHRDVLVDRSRLSELPVQALPEVRRLRLADVYLAAREQVLRSLTALAHARSRDLTDRVERQVGRMSQYYADLRGELQEQARRARDGEDSGSRQESRRATIDREEQARISELRQKSKLRVHLRLLQVLMIQQPKLLLRVKVAASDFSGRLELVWDPLLETLEAAPCPECLRPTFAFDLTRQGQVVCPECAAKAPKGPHRKPSLQADAKGAKKSGGAGRRE